MSAKAGWAAPSVVVLSATLPSLGLREGEPAFASSCARSALPFGRRGLLAAGRLNGAGRPIAYASGLPQVGSRLPDFARPRLTMYPTVRIVT